MEIAALIVNGLTLLAALLQLTGAPAKAAPLPPDPPAVTSPWYAADLAEPDLAAVALAHNEAW
jgi:hypothetical protein